MASRNKKGDDVFSMIAFAAVAVVFAAIFVFKLLVTVFLIGAPLIAVVGYVWFEVRVNPPGIPDISEYQNLEFSNRISDLVKNLKAVEHVRDESIAEGEANNIPRIQDGSRFDQRKPLGKELNNKIQDADDEIERIQKDIRLIKNAVFLTIPNWEHDLRTWITNRSTSDAILKAALCAIPIAVIGYALPASLTPPLQKLLLFDPSENMNPILIGVIAFYIAVPVIRGSNKTALIARYERPADQEKWDRLRQRWLPLCDYDEFDQNDVSSTSMIDSEVTWHLVLGVESDAAPEEIKKAYYNRRKEYNTDLAASLGPEVQELTNQRSKEINAAYEEAKLLRGF